MCGGALVFDYSVYRRTFEYGLAFASSLLESSVASTLDARPHSIESQLAAALSVTFATVPDCICCQRELAGVFRTHRDFLHPP